MKTKTKHQIIGISAYVAIAMILFGLIGPWVGLPVTGTLALVGLVFILVLATIVQKTDFGKNRHD